MKDRGVAIRYNKAQLHVVPRRGHTGCLPRQRTRLKLAPMGKTGRPGTPVIHTLGVNAVYTGFKTCCAPSTRGCWGTKHISNHDMWVPFPKRGAML